MAWPKGKKRPEGAGRKKGTLNKATVLRPKIEDILANYVPPMGLGDGQAPGFNPVQELIDIFVACKDTNPLVCAKIAGELVQYLHPKKRAVEMSVKEFTPLVVESTDGRTTTITQDQTAPETE